MKEFFYNIFNKLKKHINISLLNYKSDEFMCLFNDNNFEKVSLSLQFFSEDDDGDEIDEAEQNIKEEINSIGDDIKGKVKEKVQDKIDGKVDDYFKNKYPPTGGNASTGATNIAQNGGDAAKNAGDAAKSAGDVAKNAGNAAKNAGDAAKNAGDAAKSAGDVAKNAGNAASSAAGGGAGAVVDAADKAKDKAIEKARQKELSDPNKKTAPTNGAGLNDETKKGQEDKKRA